MAFITGASSGTERELALAYAQEVVALALLASKNTAGLSETARECEDKGSRVISFQSDVMDDKAMSEAAKQVIEHYGRVDLIFANAGVCSRDSSECVQLHTQSARLNMETIFWSSEHDFAFSQLNAEGEIRSHCHCIKHFFAQGNT